MSVDASELINVNANKHKPVLTTLGLKEELEIQLSKRPIILVLNVIVIAIHYAQVLMKNYVTQHARMTAMIAIAYLGMMMTIILNAMTQRKTSKEESS